MNLLFFQVRLFTVRVRLKLRASVALSPVFSGKLCHTNILTIEMVERSITAETMNVVIARTEINASAGNPSAN